MIPAGVGLIRAGIGEVAFAEAEDGIFLAPVGQLFYMPPMDKALTISDVEAVAAESAGISIGAAIGHVADDKVRVLLTREGKPVAAIVPIEDYEALEAIEDAQDAEMFRDALAAWEAAGRPAGIPHEEVLAEYGITFG